MVNEQLIRLARQEVGSDPLRILITGGTGFVGSHLARVMAAAGHHVTICGRNRYPLTSFPAEFIEVDLQNREAVLNLCRDRDIVYHVGARSSPWGKLSEFRAANVDGTRNVADGCLLHQVPRLVHVSSTAIFFEFRDRHGIADDTSWPVRFCCPYAQSKAESETVIREAIDRGLNAVTIRARAVFGPGDNALLPRLIAAARQGRLRQIGDGRNQIDMTYIDNLIASLLLAARRGLPGTVCTITNDEPVLLWPLLRNVLKELHIPSNLGWAPRSVAMVAATMLEWQHRLLQKPGEPVMTRYAVGLLSRNQTFDLKAAKSLLKYSPIVSMQEGIRTTLEAMNSRDESNATASVRLRMFSTGYTAHPAHLAESGAPRNQTIRFHAMFALIEHPTQGITLFDTGYSPLFDSATRRWPYKLYRWMTPVKTCEELSAISILRRNGIDPGSIRRIILSHFHADHVCGLFDFPDAEILTSARAWLAIKGRRGFRAVSRAILPELLPADLEQRLRLIEHFQSPGFGPFESTHDVFGDGSVRMVDLSGHALGQIGLLIQRDPMEDGRCLLAADAVWTSRTIQENLKFTPGFRLLAASAREARQSQQKLWQFYQQFPNIELIPTHCPDVAARYGFNDEVDLRLKT
jgi:nucleoside-diphosphate-sugar epimerase/glyoxylase-like metal-dependent hydrolase (beta-lactamase superfamily II)